MSNSPEIFVSVTRQDFNWPYAKCRKPLSPPIDTTDTRPYLLRPDPEVCKCDVHSFETGKVRYRQLLDKEPRLYDELIKVNREMTDLTSSTLDSVRDTEETIKSIYKINCEKRSLPVTRYRPLIPAIDSPAAIESPITPTIIDFKDAYRDPTRFKSSAMESLTIQPVKTRNLLNDKRETCSFWDELFTGCSEYMDTISKMSLINIKNQQRYLAPLSASRKLGSCNSLIEE